MLTDNNGKSWVRKRDPADIDVKATSKDQEMADQNVVMQLRRP